MNYDITTLCEHFSSIQNSKDSRNDSKSTDIFSSVLSFVS